MPVSDIWNIAPILAEVQRLQPKSICDLGVGYGKYGVLCREVLEAVYGRIGRDKWELVINGLEAFQDYKNPAWEAYDVVGSYDFTSPGAFFFTKCYDLILLVDSLEHIEKEAGKKLLAELVKNNKRVIVSVPLGNCPQGAVFGNEYERHRTIFTGEEDFEDYEYKVLFKGVCLVISIKGKYGQ